MALCLHALGVLFSSPLDLSQLFKAKRSFAATTVTSSSPPTVVPPALHSREKAGLPFGVFELL